MSFIYDITHFLDSFASIMGGIVLFGGHLLYFYSGKRHLKIYQKFRGEGKYSTVLGTIGVLLYIFFTIFLFFKKAAPNMGGILNS